MSIKGYYSVSLCDWKGRLCGVIFTGGCNFHCSFCFNDELAWQPDRFKSLKLADILANVSVEKRQWIDCMTISGGEPTLDPRLLAYCEALKTQGFAIKLNTNGSKPDVLSKILPIVDIVCMSIKAPIKDYATITGWTDTDKIKESISLLRNSGKVEFVACAAPDVDIEKIQKELNAPLTIQPYQPKRAL